jgi:transposase
MVEAILFLARTGIQWRYLPDRYPPWEAVWQQWRRWRENGVWARAMSRIARLIRSMKRAHVEPTMGMIDAQTVRGGRAGPTFHSAGGRGGRTIGTSAASCHGRPDPDMQTDGRDAKRCRVR